MPLFKKCLSMPINIISRTLTLTCISNRIRQIQDLRISKTSAKLAIMTSICIDLLLGWIIQQQALQWLSQHYKVACIADLVYNSMDLTVLNLKSLLTWMMENPAGLKLNSVLSQALGNFFLYHIHLWVTYVYLVVPYIVAFCSTPLPLLPYLGLSTQLSLACDLFTCLTIHIQCFYSYARRLCHSQIQGIVALWRLFIGKKYNPLRARVDSANSSVDQLLIGTIVFTILLFLFPTTLLFYCVFLALQTVASSIVAVGRGTVAVIQAVPTGSW